MNKIHELDSPGLDKLLRASLIYQKENDRAIILNSNSFEDPYGKYDFIAAFGVQKEVDSFNKNILSSLSENNWLLGHLSYDLKDKFYDLNDSKKNVFSFSESNFFIPELIVYLKRFNGKIFIEGNRIKTEEFIELLNSESLVDSFEESQEFELKARLDKREYLNHIRRLKDEIQYGNIYEINYCQEFKDSNCQLSPHILFYQLNNKFPNPFSAFYKIKEEYLLSFSPERYFCKRENKIYSQPIKGTARRGDNLEEDERIKTELLADLKERTENVMIVDLVRNDLSVTAARASVKVEELFGLYTFPNVHQLISTVSSELKEGLSLWDLIETSFPMGSMTGVPKYKALCLIDELESTKRELYSGSIGYVDPERDADFNVVIRSLIYSAANQYLSLMVGGAITSMAEAESEYEECLVKASSFLNQNQKIHD